MTKQKDLKIRIREHMAKTGKSFTAARADVLSGNPPVDGNDLAVPPHHLGDATVALGTERVCPSCRGVLARSRRPKQRPALIRDLADELFGGGPVGGAEQGPALMQDFADDLEELAECLVRGTTDHAWSSDAPGCERWMLQTIRIALRDLDMIGYCVKRRGMSLFKAKLPARSATLPCKLCSRTSWSLPLTENQTKRIADDLAQIVTMLFNGIAKYARAGHVDNAANMMGQALRQLRFSFIELGMASRWRSDPVYLAVVEAWEWEPPFKPPSAPDDDDKAY